MPRYFFNFRNGAGELVPDLEGESLPDAGSAEALAVKSARELMRHGDLNWRNCSYEIYEGDRLVTAVEFKVWRREGNQ